MCCLSPSLSAWDDPAPLRDTVWQLLLCGQQAGDAQQGRLFLQRRAVGKPPSCNPPPFLSFSFPVLDIFDNPAITSGPETDELMDKSLALNTHVSFPVKLHAFPFRYWAARPIRFLPLPLFFFFFLQKHWILQVLSSVCISVREWVCGQQTHAVSVHSVAFCLYMWVPVSHQENFFILFCVFWKRNRSQTDKAETKNETKEEMKLP